MRNIKLFWSFICITGILFFPVQLPSAPLMKLSATIDPERQFISARAVYSDITTSELTFYLNKNFTIGAVRTNSGEAAFKFDTAGKSPAYVPIAKAVIVSGIKKDLEFTYSGYIKDIINGVNMITPELVELALYSGWHPFAHEGISDLECELELKIPEGYTLITNGRLEKSVSIKGMSVNVIHVSLGWPGDIAILTSRLLKVERAKVDGLLIEMYHSEKGRPLVKGALETIGGAVKDFISRFGKAEGMSEVRFAYSPRSGWGYSRLPIYIVSEERALNLLKERYGREDELEGGIHEIAHFWWSIANVDYDWINEGLAEYSAFSFTASKFGNEYRKHRIDDYVKSVREAQTALSIIDTPFDSPDRYVNWYIKSALLFSALETRAGRDKMNQFLLRLYEQFKRGRNATTEDFLKIADSVLDSRDSEFLKRFLTLPGWSEKELAELAPDMDLK